MSGSNRKFGRCKNRPSNKRYTSEQRWVKNKAASIKREGIRVAKAAIRKMPRLPSASRDFALLQELRHIVAQSAA
jgi:hypothetical protein